MGRLNPDSIAKEIKEGNKSSYEFFFRCEFDNITHFIFSYTHDLQQAEDLAQETFCTLWEKRATIDYEKNFRAFVFRIARNKTINALKAKPLSADKGNKWEVDADIMALRDDSMDGIVDALELKKLIEDVYDNLPESAKDSFIMSRKMGMSNKEIAQKQGLTTKAVEYHMKISLKMFREKLKDYLALF